MGHDGLTQELGPHGGIGWRWVKSALNGLGLPALNGLGLGGILPTDGGIGGLDLSVLVEVGLSGAVNQL